MFFVYYLIVDIIMNLLDVVFYYFAKNMNKYDQYLPHSANIRIECKIFNLDMSAYVGINIYKTKDRNKIYPKLQKLNGSFAVLSGSSIRINDLCRIEPLLYDEAGKLLLEMCESQ